jgi:hypothetical protein
MGLEKYGHVLLAGLLSEVSPEMIKGAMIEMLSQTSVRETSEWVEKDFTLWDKIPPFAQARLKKYSNHFGDLEWLTTEWVIDSLREDHPGLASLFLGWKKANNWLTRQIDIIKGELLPVPS